MLVHNCLLNEMATEAVLALYKYQECQSGAQTTNLILGPGVVIGKQPGGGDGSALLATNLQRADHWDAVVVTCV